MRRGSAGVAGRRRLLPGPGAGRTHRRETRNFNSSASSAPGTGPGLRACDNAKGVAMNRRVGVTFLIAVILGVFAYSAFINVQRDENPRAERSIGR